MKIGSAPGVFGEGLDELNAACPELFEQSVDVRHFDGSADQRGFFRSSLCETRVSHITQIQSDTISRYRAVKRRKAVKEVDLETEFLFEEGGACRNITHEQNGCALH